MQLSKLKERINVLQVSNRSPSILQSLKITSLNAVLLSVARLRLQLVSLHSVNLISERSAPERLQLINEQLSYSWYGNDFCVKSILSNVLSSATWCSIDDCLILFTGYKYQNQPGDYIKYFRSYKFIVKLNNPSRNKLKTGIILK